MCGLPASLCVCVVVTTRSCCLDLELLDWGRSQGRGIGTERAGQLEGKPQGAPPHPTPGQSFGAAPQHPIVP